MPPPSAPEPALSKQEIFQGIRRFVTFLIISALVISVVSHTGGFSANLFQYHPIMGGCAFIGAMPEVMGSVAQMKVGRTGLPRQEVILHHQLSTFIFNICVITGIVAVEYTKYANGYPHLVSVHGLVGSTCCAAIFLQMCSGNLLRYVLPRQSSARAIIKTAHSLFSVGIIISGMLCIFGGMMGTGAAKELIPSSALRGLVAISPPLFAMWGYLR